MRMSETNNISIRLQVHLHYLPTYCGGKKIIEAEMPYGTSLKQMLAELAIPSGAISVCIVNGRFIKDDDILIDGSEVHLYALVAGG